MVTLSYSGGLQLAPAAGQHPETGVHQARKGSQHNREVQFLLNVGHFSTIMKKEPAWGSLDSSSAWNKTNGNSQHQPTNRPKLMARESAYDFSQILFSFSFQRWGLPGLPSNNAITN